MKKLFAVLLAALLLLSLVACGKTETPDGTQNATQPSQNNSTQGTVPSQGNEQNATKPSETTPATNPPQGGSADIHSHSWDYSKAQITKQPTPAAEGSQSVPCSGCSEKFTNTLPKLTLVQAFDCPPLADVVSGNEADGQNCMTAQTIVAYMLATKEGKFSQTSADFFAECGKHFALTDTLKSGIKAFSTAAFKYDSASDKFTYTAAPSVSTNPLIKGFVHNGSNKYTVYYYNSSCGCWVDDCMICLKPFHFKVELELNRSYDNYMAINKILSVTKIDAAPNNITT